MRQRVHLITLGVADLDTSADFYDALGWSRVEDTPPGIVTYNLHGAVLGLYPRDRLIADVGRDLPPGSGSMTLSANTRSKPEVDDVMAAAARAGAQVLTAAHDLFWGGYGGYFADPDGHVWEVAFNPFSPLDENDGFQWEGA